MKDREHIFYDVASTLSNNEVDIVNAQLINASDGYALQSFRLTPVNINSSEMEMMADQIAHRITDKLNNETEARQTTLSSDRKHKYFATPTVASFENTGDNNATLITIETINRTGVLATIAKVFIDCDCKVLNARISTAGEKALDYFTISTMDDKPLSTEQQNDLKQQLKKSL